MDSGLDSFHDVFASIKAGDEGVFSLLFRKYYRRLCEFCFNYVKRHDIAEEIASDALFSLWRKREEINISFSLSSYLYRTARNLSLNYLQSKEGSTSIISLSEENNEDELIESESPHLVGYAYRQPSESDRIDEHSFSEKINKIYTALSFLSPLRKEILELYFLKGLKAKEIAFKLSLSEKTVRNNIERGTRQLKQLVQAPHAKPETLVFLIALHEALQLFALNLN